MQYLAHNLLHIQGEKGSMKATPLDFTSQIIISQSLISAAAVVRTSHSQHLLSKDTSIDIHPKWHQTLGFRTYT